MPENFWIFVIKNTDEEFEKRMKLQSWMIYTYTPNRRQIQEGDKIVFYKAGYGNMAVLGTAETSSEVKPQNGSIDFTVGLRHIEVWKKRVLMKPLVGSLDFFVSKEQWGNKLQGGVLRISEKDYNTIASYSN